MASPVEAQRHTANGTEPNMEKVKEPIAATTVPWRFTAADYHRMGEVGIFHPDDRVELIEGVILRMSPIGDRHAGRVIVLTRIFSLTLGERAYISVQNAVRLSEHSEPEPDLVVMRLPEAGESVRAPHPRDILLLIEVSDTTLGFDRDTKVPLYAEAGIPEVWILDLPGDRLRIYRDPSNGEYRSITVLTRDDRVSLTAFPDITLTVEEILG
ncbi:MAG: Uma2 family endonuclease [Dehalococcoidia bacterium]